MCRLSLQTSLAKPAHGGTLLEVGVGSGFQFRCRRHGGGSCISDQERHDPKASLRIVDATWFSRCSWRRARGKQAQSSTDLRPDPGVETNLTTAKCLSAQTFLCSRRRGELLRRDSNAVGGTSPPNTFPHFFTCARAKIGILLGLSAVLLPLIY